MSVTARKPAMLGAAALVAPWFLFFVACEDTPATTEASAGSYSAGTGGAGVSGSAAGGTVAAGGVATSAGSGGVAAGTSSQAGTGGSTAGSGSAGGGAGGMAGGGGAAGMSGGGGAAGVAGSGGSGGAACGTLAKANDGSYVGTGFTAEYICTGGTCPTKNGADQGDIDKNAFDDDYQSRWSTGVYQSALKNQGKFPLFFKVDLKQAVPVSKITTHPGCKDIFDSPGTFEVEVSMNGTDFTKVTASPHTPVVPDNEACPPNANSKATDTITFPTTCARYIRLTGTQRTTSDRYWAIGEMNVYP